MNNGIEERWRILADTLLSISLETTIPGIVGWLQRAILRDLDRTQETLNIAREGGTPGKL